MGVDQLKIGDDWAQIPFGSAIDLGGCGKGYLADLLANDHVPDWVHGFWFSLGGDVVGEGFDANNEPWTVAIHGVEAASPWYFQTNGGRFAAATSSTGKRQGVNKGLEWHHLIDPRTLKPAAGDLHFASVFGASGVEADVLASITIILGSESAPKFLVSHGIEAALLQSDHQEVHFGSSLIHTETPERAYA